MKLRFNKGDHLVATNLSTQEQVSFICPADGMCKQMLTRYVVMRLNLPKGDYLFTKQ